jgi:hypothetical protein
MKNKLGLLAPTFDPKARFIKDYLDITTPPVPKPVDMSSFVGVGSGAQYGFIMSAMLANGPDPIAPAKIAPFGIGDCFAAGSVRFAALSALSRGRVLFKNEKDMLAAALDMYAKSTGWDINQTDSQGNNPTDQGTDPTQGFKWLQTTGLLCSDGSRHKFGPMLSVDPTKWPEVVTAFEIAEGIMIGVNFPEAWEDAKVWDKTNSPIAGGHEIPGYSNLKLTTSGIEIDTWGNYAPGPRIITPAGLAQQCTQLTVIINPAEFGGHGKKPNGKRRRGKNVQGFNAQQWIKDLRADGGIFSI